MKSRRNQKPVDTDEATRRSERIRHTANASQQIRAGRREHNKTLSISTLPTEVVAIIFHMLAHSGERPELVLSQVMRQWRIIALNMSTLWSIIEYASLPKEAVTTYLKRSGTAPLHARFIFTTKRLPHPTEVIWKLAEPDINRWRELTIEFNHKNHLYKPFCHIWRNICGANLTALEQLSLDNYYVVYSDIGPRLQFASDVVAPRLSHLAVGQTTFIPRTDTVTSLEVSRLFLSRRYSTEASLLPILKATRNITSLRIDYCIIEHSGPIYLPHLRRLRLSYCQVDGLICGLDVPALEFLWLESIMHVSNFELTTLPDHILPSVSSLVLGYTDMVTNDGLLKTLPNITSCTIYRDEFPMWYTFRRREDYPAKLFARDLSWPSLKTLSYWSEEDGSEDAEFLFNIASSLNASGRRLVLSCDTEVISNVDRLQEVADVVHLDAPPSVENAWDQLMTVGLLDKCECLRH